jgi:hypothetical protein
MFCKNACFSKGYRPTYVYEHCHTVTRSTVRYVTGGGNQWKSRSPSRSRKMDKLQNVPHHVEPATEACHSSNGKWASRNAEHPSHASMWVSSYVGHSVQFSDIINRPVYFDGFDMYGCFCDFNPENGGRMFLVNKALLHIRPKSEGQHRHVHSCWEPKISLKTLSPKVSSITSRIQVGYEIWKTEKCEGKIRGFQM